MILIKGYAHNGTTILSRWLSRLEGYTAVGEVEQWFAYQRGEFNHRGTCDYCSCGEKMEDCPFWNKIQSRDDLPNKIIDSSRVDTKADYTIAIRKNPIGLFLSRWKHRNDSVFKILYWMFRKYTIDRPNVDLFIPYSDFRKRPEWYVRKMANDIGVGVEEAENSHIAVANKSKYKPLTIR